MKLLKAALHLDINLAEAHLVDGAFSPAGVCHLPNHGRADEDFNWMRKVLFEDHDVLLLYKPALDGIEIDLDRKLVAAPAGLVHAVPLVTATSAHPRA